MLLTPWVDYVRVFSAPCGRTRRGLGHGSGMMLVLFVVVASRASRSRDAAVLVGLIPTWVGFLAAMAASGAGTWRTAGLDAKSAVR
uniref:hypothetical protein n=1 Tax=Pigmentiphaga litoralis TaxID=516702 RepID=UPI00389993B6